MTTEQPNLTQIEEKTNSMQQSLCTSPEVKEQLRLLAFLGRGGKIVCVYNNQGVLEYVGLDSQLKVRGKQG